MKMVAAAKLRRAQANLLAARPYTDKLVDVMTRLAGAIDEGYSHPLIDTRVEGKVAYVVLTGDKGLCGGYNHNVIKKNENLINEHSYDDKGLVTVGRKSKEYFARRSVEIIEDYVDLGDVPDFIQARELAREIVRIYQEKELQKVYLTYTRFKSAISQTPESVQLLPVETAEDEKTEGKQIDYIYEPNETEILDVLLPRYVETVVYRAVLESKASEHGARMTAMSSATDNASEMIDKLTLSFNRARQAAITNEITEIVGGADALE
jgi:F-type H+-transporting ATPase subunit gamma